MSLSDKIRTKELIVAVCVLVAFGILFALVLKAYSNEGEKRSASISDTGEKDPNHVEIFVKLVAVDPIKGDLTARLEFVPHGNLTADEGQTLAKDLNLYVNSATGKQEHTFEKGKRMNPAEVVVNLYDGLATDYPFDQHRAELDLWMEIATKVKAGKPAGEKSAGAKEAEGKAPGTPAAGEAAKDETHAGEEAAAPAASPTPSEAKDEKEVPIAVDFYGSIHGMKIEAVKTPQSTADYVNIDIGISRAGTVKFFAIFVMIAMWTLTLGVLFLTLAVLVRGRKIEVGMFSFLSALLFAFVAVRNNQPGSPPIGSLSDYLAFFWAIIIVTLCLLTLLAVWLLRPTAK